VYQSYIFAPSLGSFAFTLEDAFLARHNFAEHLVIMSVDDISDSLFFRWQFGWSVDFSAAVLNQVIFTFARNPGHIKKNSTSETWSWTASYFHTMLHSPKADYEGSYPSAYIMIFFSKLWTLFEITVGYAFISVVNAMTVRIALLMSQVTIFPICKPFKITSYSLVQRVPQAAQSFDLQADPSHRRLLSVRGKDGPVKCRDSDCLRRLSLHFLLRLLLRR
jgi:hypothetical protein